MAEMRAKHPAVRAGENDRCASIRPVDASTAVQVDPDAVAKAIRSFPKGSASGPSGLKPQHLADALTPGHAHETGRQLTGVCNLLLRGQVPEAVHPRICSATLAALPKPDGPLRPNCRR